MRSVRFIPSLGFLVALTACDENPLKSRAPAEPPPPSQGVQAFLQVDNDQARPGEHVRVYIRAQLGTGTQTKIGSYTGLLRYDAAALAWVRDQEINDGLRVSNPKAGDGEIRFAGATATGFNDLLLYAGEFEVKKSGYADALKFEMQELSAALTLGDLGPQLRIAPQVFLRAQAP
ncbi:MAG: hypothetical protein HY560_07215 [Gemmatimonadetes bacterium]|nr:hypothetical protein [Gemmatimonadota bacterium]